MLIIPFLIWEVLKSLRSLGGTALLAATLLASFAAFVASWTAVSMLFQDLALQLPDNVICAMSAAGFWVSIKISLGMISSALAVRLARLIASLVGRAAESVGGR